MEEGEGDTELDPVIVELSELLDEKEELGVSEGLLLIDCDKV